ncbi:MAG: hypothetical protein U5K72_16910 [Balneolaceae bacterium]|nr:hypothetical protein [Balneolaceae bacterium]
MAASKQKTTPYFNVAQLRIDLWNTLRSEVQAIQSADGDVNEIQKYKKEALSLVENLASIEQYYAFPGKNRVLNIGKALEREEFVAAHGKVSDLVRQLVSDSYRSNSKFTSNDEEDESESQENKRSQWDSRKNYFEVLFVDDLSKNEEQALRSKTRELEDMDEQLVYGITVQRSFQDALIALLVNYNIQSVVIRYAPPYESENISEPSPAFPGTDN